MTTDHAGVRGQIVERACFVCGGAGGLMRQVGATGSTGAFILCAPCSERAGATDPGAYRHRNAEGDGNACRAFAKADDLHATPKGFIAWAIKELGPERAAKALSMDDRTECQGCGVYSDRPGLCAPCRRYAEDRASRNTPALGWWQS